MKDRGVIWRICEDLFLQMTSKDHSHLTLTVSCVALCGDELKDLLRPEAKHFHIIEDQNGRTGKAFDAVTTSSTTVSIKASFVIAITLCPCCAGTLTSSLQF